MSGCHIPAGFQQQRLAGTSNGGMCLSIDSMGYLGQSTVTRDLTAETWLVTGLQEAGQGYLVFRPGEMEREHPNSCHFHFVAENALG